MDEKQLKDFLAENQEAMKKAATEAVLDKIKQDMQWSMPKVVQDAVNQFMVDEIAPAVVEALKSEKDGIVASACEAVAQIGDELSKVMIEKASENITGYRGGGIIKDIFQ